LGFFHFTELDVSETKELVVRTYRHLATEDLAIGAEFGVKILMIPASILKAFDEDGCALNISATWFTSDGVHVVRKAATHEAILYSWESLLLHGLLRILDRVEHHEGVVAGLEKGPDKYNLFVRSVCFVRNQY